MESWNRSVNDSFQNHTSHKKLHITEEIFENLFSAQTNTVLDVGYIFLVVLYVFIFILAAFGNGLVIILAIKYKRMRARRNVFLINLSVADLQVAIVCIPAGVHKLISPYWSFGEFLCRATHALQGKYLYSCDPSL